MSSIIDRQLMSLYVTLLLSVACLGYAELGQNLPETPYFYVGMFLALGIAYRLEGRFCLSSLLSNALALLMLLVGFVWLFSSGPRGDTSMEDDFGLIRTFVSRSGPILTSLMLAKLFRPKTASDQWLLQLLGLVQVILACVIAMSSRMDRDAPLFPVLMLCYLASLAWAFRLFYLRQEETQLEVAALPTDSGAVSWLSFKPVGWFLLTLTTTIVLFFCLPQGGIDANFFQEGDHAETGATSTIDLNAEGTIQVSDQKVMSIFAKDRNGAVQLPESLRLRGNILSVYNDNNGKWLPFPVSSTIAQRISLAPPALEENQLRLEYDMDVTQLQELGRPRSSRYSTDISIPVYLPNPPQISLSFAKNFSSPANGIVPLPLTGNLFEGQFWLSVKRKTQSIVLTQDYSGKFNAPEWQQKLRELPMDFHNYKQVLEKVPKRVASSGRIAELSQQVLLKAKLNANSSDREKARAIEQYLSSNLFKYSLDRRRQDLTIDPTEDFLFNVQEGYCERFASAMVVMLRTINIPSRIIIGYRGLEWNELGGFHIIRQLHAHAWVEALVEQTRQADGNTILHWMTLDASPASEVRHDQNNYYSPLTFARFLWEFFILDFAGQTQRARLYSHLQNSWVGKLFGWWFSLNAWQAVALAIGCIALMAGLVWLLLRWRRRVRQRRYLAVSKPAITVPFYAQLLNLLARHGWIPGTGETPAEFAQSVKQKMLSADKPAAIAAIPSTLVPPYYAVRFGAATLAPAVQSTCEKDLQLLRTALQDS